MKRTKKQIKVDIKNNVISDISNKTSISSLFQKREVYNSIFDENNINNIETINTWTERSVYGKIDNYNQPVIPVYSNLKSVTTNIGDSFFLAPVADAFIAMRESIVNDYTIGKINYSTYFPLNPKNTTLNTLNDYTQSLLNFFSIYSFRYLRLLNKKEKVNNFVDYINYSVEFTNVSNVTVTLTNYLMSRPINVTGLVVDVAISDASLDLVKQLKFIEDSNFSYILNKCEQFGFYVDKNIPWRFVFNINSPNALKYLQPYGVSNVDEFFKTFYKRTILLELDIIKEQYYKNYNKFIEIDPMIIEGCSNVNNFRYSINEDDYNDDFRWLKFHFFLKLKEINFIKNTYQYQQALDTFISLYNKDKNELIKYIENITTPFYGNNFSNMNISNSLTTKVPSYKISFKF